VSEGRQGLSHRVSEGGQGLSHRVSEGRQGLACLVLVLQVELRQ